MLKGDERTMRSERGNTGMIILSIVIVLVVFAGIAYMVLSQGLWKPPQAIADLPFIKNILPKVETSEEIPVSPEISLEDSLRNQVIDWKNKYDTEVATNSDLSQQIADKDSLMQQRDDEIARLRDTINLAQNSNLNSVALIYENMTPQDAADALSILGPEQSSLILGAMREGKAADVMDLMDETLVVEITRLMAGFTGTGAQTGPAPSSPTGSQPISPTNPGE